MITTGNLSKQGKAELTVTAKRLGIDVRNKNKQQLIAAIARQPSKSRKSPARGKVSVRSKSVPSGKAQTSSKSRAGSKSPARVKALTRAKAPSKGAVKRPLPTKSGKLTSKKTGGVGPVMDKKGSALAKQPVVAKGRVPAPHTKTSKSSKPIADQNVPKSSQRPSGLAKPDTKNKPDSHRNVVPPTARQPKPPVGSVPAKMSSNANKVSSNVKKTQAATPTPPTNPRILKKIRQMQLERDAIKDIGFRPRSVQPPGASDPVWEKEPQQDRCGLFVRDPYWLHVTWDITRSAVERAQAALAEQWHGARPILRLIRLEDEGVNSASETVQADIEIRGGVRNWYIPLTGQPTAFRVSIGYMGAHGRFYAIALSNTVKAPAATSQSIDSHWTELGPQGERIFAQSGGYDNKHENIELKEILEDRLQRSLGAPALAKLAIEADGTNRQRSGFHFDMEVELVFYGATEPDGFLTVNEQPVALRPDGSFVVRLPFPDRRQVIPAVAVARDGSHHKTIVVAVDRNTKSMEPLEKEHDSGES